MRLACLLHVFAILVLWNSSLPVYTQIGMLLVLIASFTFIARSRTPVPAYKQLSYHTNYWLLHDNHGQVLQYEQAHISFDAGLFVLLALTGGTPSKKLVIFTDQLTTSQFSTLYIIGKITRVKQDKNPQPFNK